AGSIDCTTASRRRHLTNGLRRTACASSAGACRSFLFRFRRGRRSNRRRSRRNNMSPRVSKDEFFIGWLRTPRGYARFVRPIAIALLLLGLVVAGTVAFVQRDPGSGQWADGQVLTLRGVAFTRPYAVLRVAGEKPGDMPRTYLLVEDGKFGALPRVSKFVQGESGGVAV